MSTIRLLYGTGPGLLFMFQHSIQQGILPPTLHPLPLAQASFLCPN